MIVPRLLLPEFAWRINSKLLAIAYPPLRHIDDDYERELVLHLLWPQRPPSVARKGLWCFIIFVFPILCGLVAPRFVIIPGLSGDVSFFVVAIGTQMTVFSAIMAVVLAAAIYRYRPQIAEGMRRLRYDICPRCAYDMRGHKRSDDEDLVCPECGLVVPELARRAARGAAERDVAP
jgi:hypothetical protein